MKTPVFGSGTLAPYYDATQSSSVFITSWSKVKKQAADFLGFLHGRQSMDDFYSMTGGFPADDRFDTSLISDSVAKQLWQWDTTGTQVWLENYLPPQVDQNADIAAGEMITSKSGTPAEAAKLWETVVNQWQSQHPDELKSYKEWAQH
jgi:multiple sugar transport system substrate-binding protein